MARSANQKLKLLYLIRILSQETDEDHPITTEELISRLEQYGIHAERKSIYSDIRCLTDFGFDILSVHSRSGGGYYMAGREFELAELKLLVDAVQASRFITQKKSRELIRKLEKLASRHEAGRLQRQVYVANRIKTENEGVFYHIDTLHRAIQENRRITFQYLEWNVKRQLVPRRGGARYQVSPWALVWKDENYYLAAYDAQAAAMRHFRVDKMRDVEICPESREGLEEYEKTDLAVYANRTFGMFGGREELVCLSMPEELIGVVMDRFGREAGVRPGKDGRILVRVRVVVSRQFFGWVAGLGPGIQVESPDSVRTEYITYLQNLLRDQTET